MRCDRDASRSRKGPRPYAGRDRGRERDHVIASRRVASFDLAHTSARWACLRLAGGGNSEEPHCPSPIDAEMRQYLDRESARGHVHIYRYISPRARTRGLVHSAAYAYTRFGGSGSLRPPSGEARPACESPAPDCQQKSGARRARRRDSYESAVLDHAQARATRRSRLVSAVVARRAFRRRVVHARAGEEVDAEQEGAEQLDELGERGRDRA